MKFKQITAFFLTMIMATANSNIIFAKNTSLTIPSNTFDLSEMSEKFIAPHSDNNTKQDARTKNLLQDNKFLSGSFLRHSVESNAPTNYTANNDFADSNKTSALSYEAEDTGNKYVPSNPVITTEKRKLLDDYKAKLTGELEEETISGSAISSNIYIPDDTTSGTSFSNPPLNNYNVIATSDVKTFDQYLADYNYNYNSYDFMKNKLKLPYRSFVETKKNDPVYQSLVAAWETATFDLANVSDQSTKQAGFYETILFDILYEGQEVESVSGTQNKILNTVQASALKKLENFSGQELKELLKENLQTMPEEKLNELISDLQTTKELSNVFGAISNINKYVGYAVTVEDLITKLSKAQVIAQRNDETGKILLEMYNNTPVSNWAMRYALDNMLLICAENSSEEKISAVFISNAFVSEIMKETYKSIWASVIEDCNLYGFAISAGQAAGKALTNLLFSTDESIEMYYNMCALYAFEDVLKETLSTYEYKYLNDPTNDNSKVFNESFKMLLQTHLYGAKVSRKYVEIEKEHGLVNQTSLLLGFKPDYLDSYMNDLESLERSINLCIKDMTNIAYNNYIDNYLADYKSNGYISDENIETTEEERSNNIIELTDCCYRTNNITFSEDVILDRDMTTYSLTLEKGTLDLNGHTITVLGNYEQKESDSIQNAPTLKINRGTLEISGDCNIYGNLYMTNEKDYLLCNGDFTINGGNGSKEKLTSGTVEIKGNFKEEEKGYYNYWETGNHRTVFSGTQRQEIFFTNYAPYDGTTLYGPDSISKFQNLIIENNTNTIFTSPLYDLVLNNDLTINEDTTLETVKGIDLNGHKLVVNGNLSVIGSINLNRGQLEVAGNCVIDGNLCMTNEKDYLLCSGDFIIYNGDGSKEKLTSGTVEIKGNFKEEEKGYYNYWETGNHRTVFSGTQRQEIFFTNYAPYDGPTLYGSDSISKFQNLIIENNTNTIFTSPLYDLVLNNDLTINEDIELETVNGIDLNGHKLTINGNFTSLKLLDLNKGHLLVNGNFTSHGTTNLNCGRLEITGNCTIDGYLYMKNENDYLLCNGNFSISGSKDYIDEGRLIDGVVEIKGNFYEGEGDYNYYSRDKHKTILSGNAKQEIFFTNPHGSHYSKFNILDIQNTDNIVFTSPLYDLVLYNDITLNQNTILETAYPIDLNGHKLVVNGDLSVIGKINLNSGRLEVTGNCTIDGYLYMKNENDYLLCNGNFSISGSKDYIDEGRLIDGVVEIKGNFYEGEGDYNYYSRDKHKTILSGNAKQEIFFTNLHSSHRSKFNILQITKPLSEYIFNESPCWDILIDQSSGNEPNIDDTDIVTYDAGNGALYFNKSSGAITKADEQLVTITIPSSVEGIEVREIGNNAFSTCNNITDITIPRSVVSISRNAFEGCPAFTVHCYKGSYADNIDLYPNGSTITYIEELTQKGDINGDGTINSRDSLILFKYIAGDSVAVDETLVDFNNDGYVDSRDSLILFKYVAGDSVTLN